MGRAGYLFSIWVSSDKATMQPPSAVGRPRLFTAQSVRNSGRGWEPFLLNRDRKGAGPSSPPQKLVTILLQVALFYCERTKRSCG